MAKPYKTLYNMKTKAQPKYFGTKTWLLDSVAEMGLELISEKKDKGEWNERTEWSVNGVVLLVNFKGERADWKGACEEFAVDFMGFSRNEFHNFG